jgi:hypothetical protein
VAKYFLLAVGCILAGILFVMRLLFLLILADES